MLRARYSLEICILCPSFAMLEKWNCSLTLTKMYHSSNRETIRCKNYGSIGSRHYGTGLCQALKNYGLVLLTRLFELQYQLSKTKISVLLCETTKTSPSPSYVLWPKRQFRRGEQTWWYAESCTRYSKSGLWIDFRRTGIVPQAVFHERFPEDRSQNGLSFRRGKATPSELNYGRSLWEVKYINFGHVDLSQSWATWNGYDWIVDYRSWSGNKVIQPIIRCDLAMDMKLKVHPSLQV